MVFLNERSFFRPINKQNNKYKKINSKLGLQTVVYCDGFPIDSIWDHTRIHTHVHTKQLYSNSLPIATETFPVSIVQQGEHTDQNTHARTQNPWGHITHTHCTTKIFFSTLRNKHTHNSFNAHGCTRNCSLWEACVCRSKPVKDHITES